MATAEENGTSAKSSSTSLASDKAIRPFLAPSFDPADFLNATLPTWTPPSSQRSTSESSSLQSLNSQTQALLAQLNAQLTRLSNTLTKLTDEILRSGNRLAYEVEVLRGDTTSLSDVLTEGLKDDIAKFVPPGLPSTGARPRSRSSTSNTVRSPVDGDNSESISNEGLKHQDHITQLKTLSLIRDRLDSVVKVFGSAIEWALPPSEFASKSSFISVTAPEPQAENDAREVQGREYSDRVRDEIASLAGGDGAWNEEGAKLALERIEELRELALVWKGTSEEKARLKFVEGLTKLLEDKRNPKKDTGYGLRIEPPTKSALAKR